MLNNRGKGSLIKSPEDSLGALGPSVSNSKVKG